MPPAVKVFLSTATGKITCGPGNPTPSTLRYPVFYNCINCKTMKITKCLLLWLSTLMILFPSCEKEQSAPGPPNQGTGCDAPIEILTGFLDLTTETRVLPSAYLHLKLADIEGESTDSDHKGWIDIISLSVNKRVELIGQPGQPVHSGSLAQQFSFVKLSDSASPTLKEAQASSRVIPNARLSIRRNAGDQQAYLEYELRNVKITSYQVSGSGAEKMESLSLNFEEIKTIQR